MKMKTTQMVDDNILGKRKERASFNHGHGTQKAHK